MTDDLTRALERCPDCDGRMERVTIDGRGSWECPKDGYAYDADEDDDA
jgi:hypothetical protein